MHSPRAVFEADFARCGDRATTIACQTFHSHTTDFVRSRVKSSHVRKSTPLFVVRAATARFKHDVNLMIRKAGFRFRAERGRVVWKNDECE